MSGALRTSPPLGGVFVHPRGLCESDEVRHGTRVRAFAHLLAGARTGGDSNACYGGFAENGASITDRVTVENRVMIFEALHVADDRFLEVEAEHYGGKPRAPPPLATSPHALATLVRAIQPSSECG
jgi:UDP-2-acetamido-3-amino-2,3-dideoxy-glucuronate N-acetyltransferase